MDREAALKGIARSRLLGLPVHNQTFRSTEIEVGDSVTFYKHIGRESAPKWRDTAARLGIDEAGGAAKFWGQTLMVARYRVSAGRDLLEVGDACGLVADHPPQAALEAEAMDMPACELGNQANSIPCAVGVHSGASAAPSPRRRSP